MMRVRIGYKETSYTIRQKMENGKPTGSIQRLGQIGNPKPITAPGKPTPQNKTIWSQ